MVEFKSKKGVTLPVKTSTDIVNNSLFIDSADSYKLKLKNNSGSIVEAGGGMALIAIDKTLQTMNGAVTPTFKTYALTAAQTNFDYIIVQIQGLTNGTSTSEAQIGVTPPLTAFAPCLSGWTTIANFHWQRASGFALFVAGTDYTKNSAGNFRLDGD